MSRVYGMVFKCCCETEKAFLMPHGLTVRKELFSLP